MTSKPKLKTIDCKPSIKIAAISDIHSNVFALEAVLADIDGRNVQQVVNLGDILYGPIAPKQTYELLMNYQSRQSKSIITIRGNQDRQIYEATRNEIVSNQTMSFIYDDLPITAIDWMRSLPFDYYLNQQIYLCHGSPTDDMMYLLEEVSSGTPNVREDCDIIERLAGQRAEIIVCGHTHIPRTVTLSTGQIIVNTGSVGYPAYEDDLPISHKMQTYSTHASYAIIEGIETSAGLCWQVEQIKVCYDYKAAACLAADNDREDWAFALRTGRVMPTS